MTTAINISSCFEDPQSALISAFQRRNFDAFKYVLERLHADPNLIDRKLDMSIFEKVLMTPNSSEFISLCIDNGADLYQKNVRGRYPIHFAVDSLCPDNLKTFLKYYDPKKINVRYGKKNCLHILMDMLPSENYDNIAECIKILAINGCDPNMPNEKSRTPFYTLLRVQPSLKNPNELIDFFLTNSTVDIWTYKHEEMKRMFLKQNPTKKLPEYVEKSVDCDYMLSLLRANKEAEFEKNFKLFKDNLVKSTTENDKSNALAEDCSRFLYTAIQNNMENVVELLINEGVDVNKTPAGSSSRPPVFLACAAGYYRILDMILNAEPTPVKVFESRNLLHEVCHHFGMDPSINRSVDYQKCFNLVIDHCDVNQKDDQGCTPLHYAVRYRHEHAVNELLKRSSYIGTKNAFGETPTDEINRELLEEYLDECVTTNNRRTGEEELEILIDYNFLMAPKSTRTNDEFHEEIEPLQNIADNSELRPLILHPVLSSFLYLKWSKLSFLFYGNLLLFSTFMVSLIIYIVLCQSIPLHERNESGLYCFFYIMSVISILVLMLREIFQFVLSMTNYIRTPINWFEIVLIILGWTVLLQSTENEAPDTHHRILRAVTILFAAYEFLQLAGTLPILSVSTHMVILKKVAITFLKSIALYSIVLLAFALSFYTLFGGKRSDNDADEFNSFAYPGIAIIKTFVMLTGEFDASSLDLDRNGASYCIIFLLFVFLVTIVLFNLLNALAVDDTQVIKAEGQLVDLCQRIKVLHQYERIILSRSRSWRWLKSIISIFPFTIPQGKIIIRPNRGNQILIYREKESSRDVSIRIEDGQEQELQNLNNNSSLEKIVPKGLLQQKLVKYSSMDPKIMKHIRNVLEQRSEKSLQKRREDELRDQIHSMESQLKILTDFVMKQKSS